MNEDSRNSHLQRLLESMGLIESSSQFSTDPPLPSHISGSKQIDGLWVTPNLLPSRASILPHYFGVEDHRAFILDFPSNLFLGEGFIPTARIEMRRLTSSQPQSVLNYINQAENKFSHHKIREKVDSLI